MNRRELKRQLCRDEGERRAVYDDETGENIVKGSKVHGHPTIGVGRLLTSDRGLSDDEIDYLLGNDIDVVLKEALRLPAYLKLDEVRQTILGNMLFNLGLPKLLAFEKMLTALELGDYDRAADEMLDSKWARQVGERAQRLARMMRTGRYE